MKHKVPESHKKYPGRQYLQLWSQFWILTTCTSQELLSCLAAQNYTSYASTNTEQLTGCLTQPNILELKEFS